MNLGTLTVTTFRSQPDQIDYSFANNSISAPHLLTLRRTMPVSKGTDKGEMRVNMRIVKSVAVDANGTLKELQLNVTGVIPVGAAQADIEACYQDELLVAAAATPIKTMMVSGDINLSD